MAPQKDDSLVYGTRWLTPRISLFMIPAIDFCSTKAIILSEHGYFSREKVEQRCDFLDS